MNVSKVLSYLGGYFNATKFKFDISKIADFSEMSEDEALEELKVLQSNGEIVMNQDSITIVTILPEVNTIFNDWYRPVDTMIWCKNTKLVLDV